MRIFGVLLRIMSNPSLSVIIPTYNRPQILRQTLAAYDRQSCKDFEVVVVNDGGEYLNLGEEYNFELVVVNKENGGPASARNAGAEAANGEILHFVGDDTLPHRNLVFRILYNHKRDGKRKVVQGYTVWHPDVKNEFTDFLDEAGLQANFGVLKNDDGSWKYFIPPSYCLTTNYSLHRSLYIGMDEGLKEAAWDDIDYGHRMNKRNPMAVFDSGALNYHYHPYDVSSFAERQIKEGYWRVRLCLNHQEYTSQLIDLDLLRESDKHRKDELLYWANELNGISGVQQQRWERWQRALQQILPQKGIMRGLEEFHPALKTVKYMPDSKSAQFVIGAVGGLERGDEAYALNCVMWLHDHIKSAYTLLFASIINEEVGDQEMANFYLQESLKFEPTEMARARLERN